MKKGCRDLVDTCFATLYGSFLRSYPIFEGFVDSVDTASKTIPKRWGFRAYRKTIGTSLYTLYTTKAAEQVEELRRRLKERGA